MGDFARGSFCCCFVLLGSARPSQPGFFSISGLLLAACLNLGSCLLGPAVLTCSFFLPPAGHRVDGPRGVHQVQLAGLQASAVSCALTLTSSSSTAPSPQKNTTSLGLRCVGLYKVGTSNSYNASPQSSWAADILITVPFSPPQDV